MSKSIAEKPSEPLEGWEEFPNTFVRDRCKCVYCGFQGTTYLTWRQLVIDHFIPEACRGEHGGKNQVVSCYRCNQFKAGYDPGDGRYTCLPIEGEERSALIEKAKAKIEEQEKKQGRRDFYRYVMREVNGFKTSGVDRPRRPPLNFRDMHIDTGSRLNWKDGPQTAVVSSDRLVIFNGKEMSLTRATSQILGHPDHPCTHWEYKESHRSRPRILSEIYDETYGSTALPCPL
ncbi:MAG: HNH endonuclease [Terriglobia bacterium]